MLQEHDSPPALVTKGAPPSPNNMRCSVLVATISWFLVSTFRAQKSVIATLVVKPPYMHAAIKRPVLKRTYLFNLMEFYKVRILLLTNITLQYIVVLPWCVFKVNAST